MYRFCVRRGRVHRRVHARIHAVLGQRRSNVQRGRGVGCGVGVYRANADLLGRRLRQLRSRHQELRWVTHERMRGHRHPGRGHHAVPLPPRNFNPSGPGINPYATNGTTTLNCGISTFDSSTLTFGNWCSQPTPVPVVQTEPGGADVVILPLLNLTIAAGATLRLTGNRPVILAAFGNATVAGTVDGSASGTTPGAGGNQACSPGTGGNGSSGGFLGGDGDGGGGGGHATTGGTGDSGTSGGGARGNTNVVPLLGGCPGGKAGNGGGLLGGGSGGNGGAGGGAFQISAAGALTFTGTALANGGDGAGGGTQALASSGGGGGGGSGGSVLLEGHTVTGSGTSTVNGGKGGNRGGASSGGASGATTGAPGNGTSRAAAAGHAGERRSTPCSDRGSAQSTDATP